MAYKILGRSSSKRFNAHLFNVELPQHSTRPFWAAAKTEAGLKIFNQLPANGLAIVGSRNPDLNSLSLIDQTFSHLRGSPLVIVSGLAVGVDGHAHLRALELDIACVGVLGGGIEAFYPRQNETLANTLLDQNGVLISEYPPYQRPEKYQFLKRNRWIASLSAATWVVEASEKSGALSTAREAITMGKSVFSTTSAPWDSRRFGNRNLFLETGVIPYVGPESLKTVWIDCFRERLNLTLPLDRPPLNPEEARLLGIVVDLTTQIGARIEWVIDRYLETSSSSPSSSVPEILKVVQGLNQKGYLEVKGSSLIKTF